MLFNWKELTGQEYLDACKRGVLKTGASDGSESDLTDLSDSQFEHDAIEDRFKRGVGGWSGYEDEVLTAATTEPMEEDEKPQSITEETQTEGSDNGATIPVQEGEEARDPMEDIEMALQALEDPQTRAGRHEVATIKTVRENKAGDPTGEDEKVRFTGHPQNGVDNHKPAAMEAVESIKEQETNDPIEAKTTQRPIQETQKAVGTDAAPGTGPHGVTTAGTAISAEEKPQDPKVWKERTDITVLDMTDIKPSNEPKDEKAENTASADRLEESGKEDPTHHL
jgi:hypothetical protein